ncbi:hypothetical protein HFN60_30255 [Rhizobium leguminosarum]|uniref:hypothetical protein n=1 Tax=Rhizobium leguminosarum TaxID=384 RepID=UPI001C967033|nr:hypothetical protein [Rhizobium leguminosarum]MBY5819877.1 hypothetical protein [Rhizobium leguminosarum]
MSDFDQNTDITTKLEELLKQFDGQIAAFDREGTEVSNERIVALQAEIASRPAETSIGFNKLSIIGVSFQTDVRAITALRELRQDLRETISTLQALQGKRAMSVLAMQEHLDSIEAGNGPTLHAGRKH